MAKTVVGLLDSAEEAQSVVQELVDCGFNRSDIGIMANRGREKDVAPELGVDSGSPGSGAVKGAGAGAVFGGVAGLLLGLTSLAIPGIGAIIAAGPIASALAGAGVGAVAGGLIGALTNLGVPEQEAHYYAEGVRRGGTLVTVAAPDEAMADTAASIMREHGAVNIGRRAEEWREGGWSGRFAGEEGVLPQETVRDTVRKTGVEVDRGRYTGPERRHAAMPFSGVDRRRGAVSPGLA